VKRVLLVSNAYAGSVTNWSKQVISKALEADFKLEVADTAGRNHATELATSAVAEGFDAVVAFGGDGTINEVAQGLVGTNVALGILPGGSTNVMARSFGLPLSPVDATAVVAARLRSGTERRVGVGRIGGRYFLFSAGMGLDGEVVRRVEEDPEGKKRRGEWLFFVNAIKAGLTQYRGAAPKLTLEVEGEPPARVVTAVCCNARPFTYFKGRPVDACPRASLDRRLDMLGFTRLSSWEIPRLAVSLFGSGSHVDWRSARYFPDTAAARMVAEDPLPVQVDGDYVGRFSEADVAYVPQALTLLG
jgi:diacylglycerol kinase family enzyme